MTKTADAPAQADAVKPMEQRDVDRLVRRTAVLASGMSNMWGTYLTPSTRWAADPETGEIEYDLGLASILDEDAQTGVALHEIGHLRFTSGWEQVVKALRKRYPRERDSEWATYAVNLFEDCRIERLMVEEFPGAAPAIGRLRSAWHNPEVQTQMGVTRAHIQMLNGLYCVVFGLPFSITNPQAAVLVNQYRVEALDLVHEQSFKALAVGLSRQDGIIDAVLTLRDSDPSERTEKPVQVEANDPDDEHDDGGLADAAQAAEDGTFDEYAEAQAAARGGETFSDEVGPDGEVAEGADADGYGEGDVDADGTPGPIQPGNNQGGMPGDGGGEHSATLPDPDDYAKEQRDAANAPSSAREEMAGSRKDDAHAWDDEDELDLGGEYQHHAGADGGGGSAGVGTAEEFAGMTDDARSLLEQAVNANERDDRLPTPTKKGASDVQQAISGARKFVASRNKEVTAILTRRGVAPDDDRFSLDDDFEAYNEKGEAVLGQASVLGRQLEQVLRENAFDRWSGAYESGGRLNVTQLPRVRSGDTRIFRRRNRPRNRHYAVAVAVDVSGSMRGSKMEHAALSGILLCEAFAKVPGVDFALYAFGTQSAVLKPFDMELDTRAGKVGAMGDGLTTRLGGGTATGSVVKRIGGEMIGRYDEDWRKLLIVVTDGDPNHGDEPGPAIRDLTTKHDFDVVGVGIQVAGRIARDYPAWTVVGQAYDLPNALIKIMRQHITRG